MRSMAKKKPTAKLAPSEASNDQHSSGFMVRLPEIYRTQLAKLREKNRRPMTSEVQIALEKYLAAEGLWPPEPDSST